MPAPAPPLSIDQIHLRLFVARCATIGSHNWSLHNMQDSFWRLYLNASPGAALELANDTGEPSIHYELAPHQLYFLPAGLRFHTSTRAPIEHFYIHFDVLGIPQAAVQALFDGPILVPAGPHLQTEALALATQIGDGVRPSLVTQCRIKALLYGALACYLTDLPAAHYDRYQQLLQAQAPIEPALHAIELNLDERLSNRQLADLCHLSEDYFIRLFRTSVGQSPLQYIQAQRVRRAAQHLLFSSDSIDTIAATTGFGNRAYFSRVFTRHLGIAPATYRRTARA